MIIIPCVTPRSLFMEQDQFDQIVEHLQSVWPEEGCGLIAGSGGLAQRIIPVSNVLHSRTRFRMDPEQQVACMHAILDAGLDLVGIFHSHPQGLAHPSATDLVEAAYPEVADLIFWPEAGEWKARAFCITDGEPFELELVVT